MNILFIPAIFILVIVCFIVFAMIVIFTLDKIKSDKTTGNVWEDINMCKFIVIDNTSYIDGSKAIMVRYIGGDVEFEDYLALDSASFYLHLGTKEDYPEYFL